MATDDTDEPGGKEHDTSMPNGPDEFDNGKQSTISTRSTRVVGKRFASRGIYLIAGVGIFLVAVVLSSLGFFSAPKKDVGPIPDVPVAMATKDSASQTSLDNALPKGPDRGGIAAATPGPTTKSSPGTDALSQSLADSSNTSGPPTFAPSSPQPSTQPTTIAQAQQPQYSQVPPPPAGPATVPNPGAPGQAEPQYRPQQAPKANLFIDGSNETSQASPAPTPDRMAGSDPVPPSNGSLYEPQPGGGGTGGGTGQAATAAQNNIAYANAKGPTSSYLIQTRTKALGKTEIWAGSVMLAQLDTGINTNLPGLSTAHIVNDVYDSRTGQFLLIPKGTKIVGTYNAVVDGGQNRVQTKWNLLIWPDGSKMSLEGMAGGDREGNSGNFADVNDHRGSILTASLFTGILAAGTQLVSGGGGSYSTGSNGQVIYQSVGQQIAQQGNATIQKKLAQPPELTVPRGVNFNIIIDRTIVLDPWTYGS